jgi:hypothetical protein
MINRSLSERLLDVAAEYIVVVDIRAAEEGSHTRASHRPAGFLSVLDSSPQRVAGGDQPCSAFDQVLGDRVAFVHYA